MEEHIKAQIEDARAEIQALEEQQNLIYQNIAGLVDKCYEEYLWDYCFNCKIGEQSEYVDIVRDSIFE
jgi:hypothetical protein